MTGVNLLSANVSQLDGTIVAPENHAKFGKDPSDWMVFEWLTGLKIQGRGMIQGRGSGWWHVSPTERMDLSDDDGHFEDDNEEYSPTVPVTFSCYAFACLPAVV